jgi:nitroreductase
LELRDAVRRRHMVRSFRADPVADDALDRVLDAGRRAPSAGFSQGCDLLVLRSPAARTRFWDVAFPTPGRSRHPWPGLFEAPVVIVPLADADTYLRRYRDPDKRHTGLGESAERWPVPYWLTDTAMAVQNMLLAATDEGLGALFFGLFGPPDGALERPPDAVSSAVKSAFGVPEGRLLVGAVALGHPGEDRASASVGRGRRPLDEVVHHDRW